MSMLLVRVVLLAGVLALAWWAVATGERRGRSAAGIGQRLVLITGDGCRLCGPAEQALLSHGVAFSRFDVRDDHGLSPPSALPTAVVLSDTGAVVMRRSGRSVIDDAMQLAAAVSATAERG